MLHSARPPNTPTPSVIRPHKDPIFTAYPPASPRSSPRMWDARPLTKVTTPTKNSPIFVACPDRLGPFYQTHALARAVSDSSGCFCCQAEAEKYP